jgi:hypothetical protein
MGACTRTRTEARRGSARSPLPRTRTGVGPKPSGDSTLTAIAIACPPIPRMGIAPTPAIKLSCGTPSTPQLEQRGSTAPWMENRAGLVELLGASRRAPPRSHLHGQPLPGTVGVNEDSLGEYKAKVKHPSHFVAVGRARRRRARVEPRGHPI